MSDMQLFMVGCGIVSMVVMSILSVLFHAHRLASKEEIEMAVSENQRFTRLEPSLDL